MRWKNTHFTIHRTGIYSYTRHRIEILLFENNCDVLPISPNNTYCECSTNTAHFFLYTYCTLFSKNKKRTHYSSTKSQRRATHTKSVSSLHRSDDQRQAKIHNIWHVTLPYKIYNWLVNEYWCTRSVTAGVNDASSSFGIKSSLRSKCRLLVGNFASFFRAITLYNRALRT